MHDIIIDIGTLKNNLVAVMRTLENFNYHNARIKNTSYYLFSVHIN